MGTFLGKIFEEVLEEIGEENIDYELNFISHTNEAFGGLRIISEKFKNGKWYFVLSYENYQERAK
ncbi:MAG TPA: hypothetical protein PKW23_03135 [Dictyoglomaceae bacterium]|nr:hypothetical protein [Dictyoglomaceae bacterium]HOL39797.1 hypothetical protein [Dictyoglomaceae bacterium]HOP95322.1 hypothetical protein [Dictyoglomaceae bacterium]HPP16212.1 hypothetical protein [Dictyoglomaceae bacterium]HPU42938.1 hypothetical protein [Dictyoglomaceae bacterium]